MTDQASANGLIGLIGYFCNSSPMPRQADIARAGGDRH
jgi:hypothetical protein